MQEDITDSIRVTLLGTGHPEPLIERFGQSTLVEAGARALSFLQNSILFILFRKYTHHALVKH